MDISKGLILKGTAATTAVATTSTGAYYHEEIGDIFTSLFSGEDEQEGVDQPVNGDAGGRTDDNVRSSDQNPDSVSETANAEKTGKDSLGLPESWEWPNANNEIKTSDLTIEQLKKVNFDGKGDNEITSTSAVSLTIEKVDESNKDFPQGFKFIFKTKNDSDEVTISGGTVSIVLKKGMNLEFKIKENGNKWSLERVWNDDAIEKKIGLDCKTNTECTLKANGAKLNVKDGNDKRTDISQIDPSSGDSKKIKLYKNEKDYNQGLKFAVEGGDINLSNGTGSKVTKLKESATYEIKELDEGGKKWFLVKKTPSTKEKEIEGINEKLKTLGIPTKCLLEGEKDSKECDDLTGDDLNGIKFDGKGSESLTVASDVKFSLKIKKVSNDSNFGNEKLKFSFTTFPVDVTLDSSSAVILKKGTNPEFKVKGSDSNLTLERAWTVSELGRKVGLNCPVSGTSNECSFSGSLKVYEDSSKKTTSATVSDKDKRLEFTENVEDYNQGFKFVVKGNENISLTPNDAVSSLVKANTSYEIKHITGDGWYLHKITTATA